MKDTYIEYFPGQFCRGKTRVWFEEVVVSVEHVDEQAEPTCVPVVKSRVARAGEGSI